MDNYDFYDKAHIIILDLREMGLAEEADKILDALASGSTSTEVLMALRWQLQSISGDGNNVSAAVLCKINELISRINCVLK